MRGDTSLGDRLSTVFSQDAILFDLRANSRAEVVEQMVRHFAAMKGLACADERVLVQAIAAQERSGTTDLGNGIAFYHCRSPGIESPNGVVALTTDGVLFDSTQSRAIFCIFLLISPQGSTSCYDILGRIAAVGGDKGQRMRLLGCRTQEAVHRFLCVLDQS